MLGLELAHDFLGGPPLRVIMIEDGRTVLRPDVAALAIERGRIVQCEEHTQQVAIRELVRVERHLHDLGVAGRAGAYRLVAGVGHVSAGVS